MAGAAKIDKWKYLCATAGNIDIKQFSSIKQIKEVLSSRQCLFGKIS